jgi:hypothetical protein
MMFFQSINFLHINYELEKSACVFDFKFWLCSECYMVFLGNSSASEFYKPTFRNTLSVSFSYAGKCEESSHLPAYEDGTDIVFRNVEI